MSRNIKEIGKELMGKSLNSYHRKTGLTQLEKNNEMQDGILNGILSQVDDAYIEKTEQSNVIHLDGSGDGVVVVDSIKGNTMVNLVKLPEVNERTRNTSSAIICLQIGNSPNSINLKTNATYTCFVSYDIKNISSNCQTYMEGQIKNSDNSLTWFSTSDRPNSVGSYRIVKKVDTSNISKTLNNFYVAIRSTDGQDANATIKLNNIMLLEGDWTNKEIPSYFEGLQSSFEEKVNDEGKYEIEILNNNKNLFDLNKLKDANNWNVIKEQPYHYIPIRLKPNTTYKIHCKQINSSSDNGTFFGIFDEPAYYSAKRETLIWASSKNKNITFTTDDRTIYYWNVYFNVGFSQSKITELFEQLLINVQMEENTKNTNYIPHKQNKIKLLINEPLRATDIVKDKICIKDNKLVIERNCGEVIFNGEENWQDTWQNSGQDTYIYFHLTYSDFGNYAKYPVRRESIRIVSDYFNNAYCGSSVWGNNTDEKVAIHSSVDDYYFQVSMLKSNLSSLDKQGFKNFIKSRNGLKFVYKLAEPYYEEVLNEYGEPIILEGYENGTLFIDSTIVPTATVRYTPKMESFKAIKEVKDNNIMLTTDINDAIIPYMLEVDMMILEKEMAIMSHKNIRKIGEKDMTNMQKRTYDMLARLIKGKTLNEQECKTRVTVYLNAGKITDEQAKELNFLIDEIYA